MKRLETIAASLFGLMFLGLAFAVAVETLMRKVMNRSLQGVDELGGYILAAGAALAFAVALIGRAHIRIDLVHYRLPRSLRVALNIVSAAALTATALAVLAMGWIALSDSILFQATAQTPWATPLQRPQTVWVGALALFALVCLIQLAQLVIVAAREGVTGLDRGFGPRSTQDELNEELADIRARGALDVEALPGTKP